MVTQRIVIDPVTRIEGHSKVTIMVGESGQVIDARFHVTQVRGFEKFCENRPLHEMPSLMARICGICPVSHLIASAKACDAILAVAIPENAARLRRVLNLAQLLQSHALSVFHLSSPDFLLGMDSDPVKRNIFGVAAALPHVAADGIRLRQIGQTIIEILGGKKIHPAWVVPGGVSSPLTKEKRDQILAMIPDAFMAIERTVRRFRELLQQFPEEIESFANFPSLFLGLTNPVGNLEHYDGPLCISDADGAVVARDLKPNNYPEYIGEVAEDDSYLKSAYYRPMGYPDGIYRVGPLARLNLAVRCGTPLADQELETLRRYAGRPMLSSFHYHHARLVEMLYAVERMTELLDDPDILNPHVRAHAEPNREEGVGIAEAPRGTLLHHYKVDKNGLVQFANLIIATGNNNLALNRGVKQVATHFVRDGKLSEGALNRVEAVVRAFDPCLSCSTHAAGRMPLVIELRQSDGKLLDTARRPQ
ncbi:MAG: Ni/Fe hydrogenase subunit alpha [Bryobacteraceae bacterium]